MAWWSNWGSVATNKRGSRNAFWIWLVKVPGVNLPAIGVAPVACANLSTARWKINTKFSILYLTSYLNQLNKYLLTFKLHTLFKDICYK